ncbi:sodium:solute symporter family protein [Candidatus Chrysopegis kryptomonas]|uniref:Solute:Na+ symporter, SSS family n=1 Tax=Candidatus Chryseopegocella kryptomonas TaxID=1633643 RepID=A0A0P1MP95_9BACT|nr:sodium:solute symporter family protein [Candidatus Chrysopegis kryptomonas]CUS97580.1 solute:Na+ symporter, SSS family [Candidatus Chrysopegis kryptomonas]
MQLIDWLIVALYFILSIAIGVYYSKRAGKSIGEFFLSGRNLPWWLAGTSMVATTFAADTPLAVTELVAKNGIAGNWLWWNFLFGSMLTVFFFARLWRRAGILTDVEFVELRYSGKPASFLRGFKALYLGLFINTVIIGWVNVAMVSILTGFFGVPEEVVRYYVFGAMLIVAIYSALSGLWGVAVTDAVQFVIAMTGTIILAILVVNLPQVGGVSGLKEKLPEWVFNFTPVIGSTEELAYGGVLALTVSSFIAYILVQWWASWYPGAEPGGGGYVAQRMMSAKDEKHSLLATLWFTIAHYCVRPWPWIIVGLATLVLYPELGVDDKKLGYIYTMRDYLPVGLKGLLISAFFAAYMSTIATHLNWGTSYVINDFYKRFIKKDADEKHYVFVSRVVTLLVMVASVLITLIIKTISGAWQFIIEASAGFGLVLILRWYWWRINAWSEIVAMIAPFFGYAYIKFFTAVKFPETLFYIVAFTTISWLVATFLTKPVEQNHLINFYRRVHPGGIGWRKIARIVPDVKGDSGYGYLFIDWISGVVLVYMFLFGIGKIVLGEYLIGLIYLAIGLIAGSVIYFDLSKRGWEKAVE